MKQVIILINSIFIIGCTTPPDVKANKNPGRHFLPYKPNEQFVLNKIHKEPFHSKIPFSIEYFINGKRKIFAPDKVGSTDGNITYLRRKISSEIEGVESPIIDEHIVRLHTGEEITIVSNTLNSGEIRLRTVN